jgi:hypothetical protein
MKYQVIASTNLTLFQARVEAALAEGWQLQGGMTTELFQHGSFWCNTYLQAMVKDEV